MIVQVVGEEAEKSCPGFMLVVLVKKQSETTSEFSDEGEM